MMDSNHTTGTILGAIIAIGKSLYVTISVKPVFSMISWELVFDTALLALIGGALGWCGAELMKLIKKRFFKSK